MQFKENQFNEIRPQVLKRPGEKKTLFENPETTLQTFVKKFLRVNWSLSSRKSNL